MSLTFLPSHSNFLKSIFNSIDYLQLSVFINIENVKNCKGKLCFSVVEALPCSGCFIACMGAHSLVVELDCADWFSISLAPRGVRLPVAKYQMGPPVRLQYNKIRQSLEC